MAELNTPDKQIGSKKVRSKKMDARVDLTAMVDLAFLLITFFMLTTTLAKPQSMNLAMPDKSDPEVETKISDFRTLTVLLGTDNKIVWYMGQISDPLEGPDVTTFGKGGIRDILIAKNEQVLAATQDEKKGLIVVIKPSDKSIYRNMVDILDEMAITKIRTYAIIDITEDDINLLKEKGLYPTEDVTDNI